MSTEPGDPLKIDGRLFVAREARPEDLGDALAPLGDPLVRFPYSSELRAAAEAFLLGVYSGSITPTDVALHTAMFVTGGLLWIQPNEAQMTAFLRSKGARNE